MIRNLKLLGLALAAVFAMSAVAAQAAFGVDTFTSSVSPVGVTGTGNNDGVFKITGGLGEVLSEFHCSTTSFPSVGTVTSGASQVEVAPSYKGTNAEPGNEKCESTLGNVKIDMNGCTYVLTGNTTGSDNGTDATVWVKCPPNAEIQITAALGCTISVPAQTPTSGGVTYTNNVGSGDVTVTATVTGITFTTTSACQVGGLPAEANTSDYTETITAKANSGTLQASTS